jgi:hypothetical protein
MENFNASRRSPRGPATQILSREGLLHKPVEPVTWKDLWGKFIQLEGVYARYGITYMLTYLAKIHFDAHKRVLASGSGVCKKVLLTNFFAGMSCTFGLLAYCLACIKAYFSDREWTDFFDAPRLELIGRTCFLFCVRRRGKARLFYSISYQAYQALSAIYVRYATDEMTDVKTLSYLWASQMPEITEAQIGAMVAIVKEYYMKNEAYISGEHAAQMRAFLHQFEYDPDTRMPGSSFFAG